MKLNGRSLQSKHITDREKMFDSTEKLSYVFFKKCILKAFKQLAINRNL